jgi:hypothetical protein
MVESLSKKAKSFVISTAEARYVKPLLQYLIQENQGWEETLSKDKFDFKWFNSTVEDAECKIDQD